MKQGTVTITQSITGASIDILLIQNAVDIVFSANPVTINASPKGEAFLVNIKSYRNGKPYSWVVTSKPNWVDVSSKTDSRLGIVVNKNEGDVSRSGEIILSQASGNTITINIIQGELVTVFEVTPQVFELDIRGGIFNFTLVSTINGLPANAVPVAKPDWVSLGAEISPGVFPITFYGTYLERTSEIVFSQVGSGVLYRIYITQKVLNTGSVYAGGSGTKLPPMTVEAIQGLVTVLPLDVPSPFILMNAVKGSKFTFTIPTTALSWNLVTPKDLGSITEVYDNEQGFTIEDQLILSGMEAVVDGVLCQVRSFPMVVPTGGVMTLDVTL